MANPYSRPEGGWRYNFGGMKINAPADSLNPDKYPLAMNIRPFKDSALVTRPGYTPMFNTTNAAITDIGIYSTLLTDDIPRALVRNVLNQVYLDTGALVATLDGQSAGASMLPYRPNQSPQSWMYVGTLEDYKKISAPNSLNAVSVYKVGIEEPHDAPQIAPNDLNWTSFVGVAADWTPGGTAGATSNQVDTATVTIVLKDPAASTRYSIYAGPALDNYQVGAVVNIAKSSGGSYDTMIEQVIPAISATNLKVESVIYLSGSTGRCIITPTQIPNLSIPSGNKSFNALSLLQRGSIVTIGAENCYVLSCTIGDNGSVSFEVSSTGTIAVNDAIVGSPAIVVSNIDGSLIAAQTLTIRHIDSNLTNGTATLSHTLSPNPFTETLDPQGITPQPDDVIYLAIRFSDLSKLTMGTVIFDVNSPTAADYATNVYTYTFTPASLIGFVPTVNTVYPVSKWYMLAIPINTLSPIGAAAAKTLVGCQGIRFTLVVTGNTTFSYGPLDIGGGGQVNVGTGTPFFYATRGRSSLTGAVSNPSPVTRYGIFPIRQQVFVLAQDTVLDPQMDLWDIFRVGGSISTLRYVGSMPNSGGSVDTFIDNFTDAAAAGGSLIEYDNFQPWPTIDLPYIIHTGTVGGITTQINVSGTSVIITFFSASVFTDPFPSTIARWLPGTLFVFNNQKAYALWNRPTAYTWGTPPGAHYFAYLLQFSDSIGDVAPTTLSVNEPNVARQPLPYLWGPDAYGTIFGCGDIYRPGNVYFSKSNIPDSAPDSYNQELAGPSEPLIGGEIVKGVSLVGSPARWWALYPQLSSVSQRYQAVQQPVQRGLAGPCHCNDGNSVYFLAHDGIWTVDGRSLTDDDLYTLFPHDGVIGSDYVYAGVTIRRPDYQYAAYFRLNYINGYLYFDYRDSDGGARNLVCDITDPSKPKWMLDVYSDPVTTRKGNNQQVGTLINHNGVVSNYTLTYLGGSTGFVHKETVNHNDGTNVIQGIISTFEYNGGDIREDQLFNDLYMDVKPISGITPYSIVDGAVVTSGSIPQASARIQTNLPLGRELKYVGLLLSWLDDFSIQSEPTQIFSWQPLYQGTPIKVFQWNTQFTSFGLPGYKHIPRILFAYRADADVTLTIETYDGQDPAVITLPASLDAVVKTQFWLTFNKGLLYKITGNSTAEWAPYLSECEFYVGAWGREGRYALFTDLPGPEGIKS